MKNNIYEVSVKSLHESEIPITTTLFLPRIPIAKEEILIDNVYFRVEGVIFRCTTKPYQKCGEVTLHVRSCGKLYIK